jgi:peptide/nickel transport system substrate-binding protein
LLREAGYPNGFDMTITSTIDAYPADRDICLAVAAQLNEAGVRARIVFLDLGVQLDTIRSRKMPYDGAFLRSTDWIGYAGSIAIRAFTPAGAFALWVPDDPQFDQLLQTGETTLDRTKAADAYRRAQLIFKDQCPAINLMTAPNAYGMSRKLIWTPRADLALTMVDAAWQT